MSLGDLAPYAPTFWIGVAPTRPGIPARASIPAPLLLDGVPTKPSQFSPAATVTTAPAAARRPRLDAAGGDLQHGAVEPGVTDQDVGPAAEDGHRLPAASRSADRVEQLRLGVQRPSARRGPADPQRGVRSQPRLLQCRSLTSDPLKIPTPTRPVHSRVRLRPGPRRAPSLVADRLDRDGHQSPSTAVTGRRTRTSAPRSSSGTTTGLVNARVGADQGRIADQSVTTRRRGTHGQHAVRDHPGSPTRAANRSE